MIASIEIIGFIAAILTTGAFVPQVFKIWKTKNTDGLSLSMYLIMFFGVLLWLMYGITIKSPSMIFANGITATLQTIIIVYILNSKRKR